MTIFERVRALGFPDGHYVIAGSGILAARGIREAKDLDVVADAELFENCKSSGWESKPWTRPGMEGKNWLKKGDVEITDRMFLWNHGHSFTCADLLQEAEMIQGIPFLSLARLAEFKKEYGRPKDFEDIRLIEEYLANQG